MKLCFFSLVDDPSVRTKVGVVQDGKVFESEAAAPGEKVSALGNGHDLMEVKLYSPIMRPGKIIAAIVNTKAMLGGEDVGLSRPRLDMKAPSAVIGPGEAIQAPQSGIRPEVELAAVLAGKLSEATPAEAKKAILGYTVLNDVTAPGDSREDAYEAYRRDPKTGKVEKRTLRGPLFRSKNHDTFCPLGPWLVTPDEIGDASTLRMSTKFDDMLVQYGSTAEYLFRPEEIASYVSGFLTLEPGDVISCGSVGWTPEALGELDTTEFLLPRRAGILRLEIERIGVLTNPVVLKS